MPRKNYDQFRYDNDNLFTDALNDTRRLYPEAGNTKSGNGLTGPDIAGIGLQVAGSMQMDKEAKRQEEREDERERLSLILRQRDRLDDQRRDVMSDQQTTRSLNMTGATMLAEMRQNALKNRRLYSTRKAFAGAF